MRQTRALRVEKENAMSEENQVEAGEAEKVTKSIVPSRYGNKYRNGGSDELATFINGQCAGKDGFEYPAFFELCRKNGIAEDKVNHYASQVEEKRHGAPGRARMTLRNMLASIARKEGKLVGLDGETHAVNVPKPAVSGAAAKAKEDTAA